MTRYLTSEFLGHCTAGFPLQIQRGDYNLNPSKLIQMSMDGPNVNFKFYRDLIADRLIEHPAAPLFLDLGSCGLHVVHGAFKTGVNSTGWKIENLLRSLYYLLSD